MLSATRMYFIHTSGTIGLSWVFLARPKVWNTSLRSVVSLSLGGSAGCRLGLAVLVVCLVATESSFPRYTKTRVFLSYFVSNCKDFGK